MGKSKRLIITTSGDRSMEDIKKDLTDEGFAVDQVFDEIGSISGKVDDDKVMEKIKKVKGVTDVSPEHPDIDIGRPGDSELW